MNLPWLTRARKRRFAGRLLADRQSPIGLLDVGAGGTLRSPWALLPVTHLRKFDFEPEGRRGGIDPAMPSCVSDHNGPGRLFVARDPRSSSLHPACGEFVRRFANDAIESTRELDVDCVTLDTFFAGRLDSIDAADINAEGHDFRVLDGAKMFLTDGCVSLLKVEVLFSEVWQGQGWFSDIDQTVRGCGYDLLHLELDFDRPAAVKGIHHRGELLWGKAFYVPSAATCVARLTRWQTEAPATAEDRVLKAIVLLVMIEALGRAMELIDAADRLGILRRFTAGQVRELMTKTFRFARLEAGARAILEAIDVRPIGRAVARMVVGP